MVNAFPRLKNLRPWLILKAGIVVTGAPKGSFGERYMAGATLSSIRFRSSLRLRPLPTPRRREQKKRAIGSLII